MWLKRITSISLSGQKHFNIYKNLQEKISYKDWQALEQSSVLSERCSEAVLPPLSLCLVFKTEVSAHQQAEILAPLQWLVPFCMVTFALLDTITSPPWEVRHMRAENTENLRLAPSLSQQSVWALLGLTHLHTHQLPKLNLVRAKEAICHWAIPIPTFFLKLVFFLLSQDAISLFVLPLNSSYSSP